MAPHGPDLRGDRLASAPARSPTRSWGGLAASRPRSHLPGEREAGRDGAGCAGQRGRPWCAGRPRRTECRRRRRASTQANRRAGGRGRPSCQLWRPKCPPSGVSWHSRRMRAFKAPRQAHTAGPLPPALGASRAVRGRGHRVTTAVHGRRALEDGAKEGVSVELLAPTKPGDKKWRSCWTGINGLGGTVPVANCTCAPSGVKASWKPFAAGPAG